MMAPAVAAMMLFCTPDSSSSAKTDPRADTPGKMAVDSAMLESLRGEPPVSPFSTEAKPLREWIISGMSNLSTRRTRLVRLTKSGDPLKPFGILMGDAVKKNDGSVEFQELATGKCDLRPSDIQSKGLTK